LPAAPDEEIPAVTPALPSYAPTPPDGDAPTATQDVPAPPSPTDGEGTQIEGADETTNIMGKSISFGMTRDEVLAVLFPDGVQDGDIQGFGLDGG
jgi:hypothetical protein